MGGGRKSYNLGMKFSARPHFLAGLSVVALAGLAVGLVRVEAVATGDRPLIVSVAAGLRTPAEAVAMAYTAETGQRVELRFGASEDLLTRASFPIAAEPTDVFLPADESYVRIADERRLVERTWHLGTMHAVVLTSAEVGNWNDLLRQGRRVGLGQPGSAIGKLTREHLQTRGLWNDLAPHVVETGTVTESANAAKVKAVPAAIVWNVVAHGYPQLKTVDLPELDGCIGTVRIATLKQSRRPADAEGFALFASDPERGGKHFRAAGLNP